MNQVVTPDNARKRLSGITAFGFGLNWESSPSIRETLINLLIFLDDKRVLYVGHNHEFGAYAIRSIDAVREELVKVKQMVKTDKLATSCISAMQVACRKFMDNVGNHYMRGNEAMLYGELRSTFGREIACISAYYNINIEGDLVSILPPEMNEDDIGSA